MKRQFGAGLVAFAMFASVGSLAQQYHSNHADHGGRNMNAAASEATQAFEAANAQMHQSMAITYSGNADIDFARGMIPHHKGAIDMAKVVLQYGKDPEIRKLAEAIVDAQDKEIAWMEGWLKRQGQ